VRVDSAAYPGFTITPDYDSLIAKLIVRGRTRDEAMARLGRAIDEYVIAGVQTTLPMLRALIDYAPVADASYGTATLEPFAATLSGAAANGAAPTDAGMPPPAREDETIRVEVDGRLFRVRFVDLPLSQPSLARPAASKPVTKGRAARTTGAVRPATTSSRRCTASSSRSRSRRAQA